MEKPEKKKMDDKKTKDGASVHKRFEVLTEALGNHSHNLRSARRQEKLTDLLRDMMGGRKKDDQVDEQQLSLMSTWIDQFKTERDKLAADKKGGPNATASLVDKYGKCQEIVGRGAFGIVRISHKVDPQDSKCEQLYAVYFNVSLPLNLSPKKINIIKHRNGPRESFPSGLSVLP